MNLEGGSSKANNLLNVSVYLKEIGKCSFWECFMKVIDSY